MAVDIAPDIALTKARQRSLMNQLKPLRGELVEQEQILALEASQALAALRGVDLSGRPIGVVNLDVIFKTPVNLEELKATNPGVMGRLREWREGREVQQVTRAREILEELGVRKKLEEVQGSWREGQIKVEPWRHPLTGYQGAAAILFSKPYPKLVLEDKGDVSLRRLIEMTTLQVAVGYDGEIPAVFVKESNIYDVQAAQGSSVNAAIMRRGLADGLRSSAVLDKRRVVIEPVRMDPRRSDARDILDDQISQLESLREGYESLPKQIRRLTTEIWRDLPPLLRR